MLDQELATYDTLIWSDGSLRVEDQIGSAGYVWNNALGEILGELGETFYPIFSSFQAETLALMCALKNCFMYDENVTDKSICILSDSQGLLRHLKKLQLCSSHVSSAVIDILEEIKLAYERKCKSITFKWIPGHSGLGYNPRADRLASKAYKQDPCPNSVPIPVKTLQHVATRRMDDKLLCYLDQSVCSSEDDFQSSTRCI